MKNSEELRAKAATEDNDFKALGLYVKAIREQRLERLEKYLPGMEKKGYVLQWVDSSQKLIIDTSESAKDIGIIDYYPKANKILIRKKNEWKTPGLNWLITNLKLLSNE